MKVDAYRIVLNNILRMVTKVYVVHVQRNVNNVLDLQRILVHLVMLSFIIIINLVAINVQMNIMRIIRTKYVKNVTKAV